MRNAMAAMFAIGVGCVGCGVEPTDEANAESEGDLEASACAEGADCATTAKVDDSFTVATGDGCGRADFVDYGPGAPGGGNNDDYIVIHDFCADSHGVKAWAWVNGVSPDGDAGGYDGNGLAGAAVVWDPFKQIGNIEPGDRIRIKVCLADSANASSGLSCRETTRTSIDG